MKREGPAERPVFSCHDHDRGFHPPFSFCGVKERTGGGAVQEKKRWRGTCAYAQVRLKYGSCSSELPPKLESPTGAPFLSVESASPAFTPRRSSLVVEVKPILLAPLTLHRSASGNRRRECPKPPKECPKPLKPPRNPRRDPDFSVESASPACTLRRSSLVVEVKPILLAPLTLHRSASGNRRRGCPKPSKPPRHPRRGQRLSGLLQYSLTAQRFFLLDRARPDLFLERPKREWGAHILP